MNELTTALTGIKREVDGLIAKLEIPEKANEIAQMEEKASAPDFWDDPEAAQKVMQQIARLRNQVEPWQKISARVNDALELARFEDTSLLRELAAEMEDLTTIVDKMSFRAMFSGPYDAENAILAIHAGAGGTDSQDWAEMLERMYIRWAEQNGYQAEVIERSHGEEAGIKSVMISIAGGYAYGYLRSEQGVHRLVRLSPFDAANRRHTSFAKVELWPDIQGEIDIEINEKDLRIDTYRASGPGGQHVQKSDTAVRITHLPSGVVVQCQNQRSQLQNRQRAMQILKARLLELERRKQAVEFAELKGENVDAGWGNQIRSYVLHPYQMVKDHRTKEQVGDVTRVLDGDIDAFINAYLKEKAAGTLGQAAGGDD